MALSPNWDQFKEFENQTIVISQTPNQEVSFIDVTVDNVAISNVNVTLTSNVSSGGLPIYYALTFTVTGAYGDDVTVNDNFVVVNTENWIKEVDDIDRARPWSVPRPGKGHYEEFTYTSYTQLLADMNVVWNEIIQYSPDQSPFKTASFNFIENGVSNSYTQIINLQPQRWNTRLQNILNTLHPDPDYADANGDPIVV